MGDLRVLIPAWLDQHADDDDRVGSFGASGLANWWRPGDHHGPALSNEHGVGLVEDLAAADAGLAFAAAVSGLAGRIVDGFASAQVRHTVLDDLGRHGGYLATAASEHGAGSELQRMETTVRRVGSQWEINGHKAFVTNATRARHIVVICRVAGSDRDFRAVVVPRDSAGMRPGRAWSTVGLTGAETQELVFDRVQVPADHACEGNGLRILETGLNVSRLGIAAVALGSCRRLLSELVAYSTARTVAGAPLRDHPTYAGRLADLSVAITAMRWVVQAAARGLDQRDREPSSALGVDPEVVAAKLFCGQTAWAQVTALSGAMGGLGYVEESAIERALRDARHASIIEGGEDVLRELIHRRVVRRSSRVRRSPASSGPVVQEVLHA